MAPWTIGSAWRTGVIPDPRSDALADGQRQLGHAICTVGRIDDTDAPGGGWFIFRNSWGTRFGYKRPQSRLLANVLAPGYGAISARHIDVHCWGMMALYESPVEE
ncbi:hypothetical protein [Shimia sp.]|uniref:hypothetical protein n=1 Tax=Shimia sp. TaxID=1954381 RepID=UPI003BAAEA3B